MRVEMLARVMAEMEDEDQCGLGCESECASGCELDWPWTAKFQEMLRRPNKQVDRHGLAT